MKFDDPIATVFQIANIESKNTNPTKGLQLLDGKTSDDSEVLQTAKDPTIQGKESCIGESMESSDANKGKTSCESATIIEHGKSNDLTSFSDDHNILVNLVDESDTQK